MKFFLLLFLTLALFGEEKKEPFVLQIGSHDDISMAQKLIDENKIEEAQKLLLSVKENKKIKKPADLAYIRFFLGYFYAMQESFTQAIDFFEASLTYNALNEEQLESAYLYLVQLTLEQGSIVKTLNYLDALIDITKKPKKEYYIYKAKIFMQQQEYKKTLQALDNACKNEQTHNVDLLKMKLYAHYMLQENQEAVGEIKKLLVLEPHEKRYWLQLSSFYTTLGEKKSALASIDASNIAALNLQESEVLLLVGLLHESGIPYKAAVVLEKKIEEGVVKKSSAMFERLGDLFLDAAEVQRALFWYKEGTRISKSGALYYKIGRLCMNKQDFECVVQNIEQSLKDSKEDEAQKYLLLGRAYYELHQSKKAQSVFEKVLGDAKYQESAKAWLAFLERQYQK